MAPSLRAVLITTYSRDCCTKDPCFLLSFCKRPPRSWPQEHSSRSNRPSPATLTRHRGGVAVSNPTLTRVAPTIRHGKRSPAGAAQGATVMYRRDGELVAQNSITSLPIESHTTVSMKSSAHRWCCNTMTSKNVNIAKSWLLSSRGRVGLISALCLIERDTLWLLAG